MSEFNDLTSITNAFTAIVQAMSNVLTSATNGGTKLLHGEKNIIASIASGQDTYITTFDVKNKNLNTAKNQKKLLEKYKSELNANNIPYMVLEFKDGSYGVVTRDQDLERIKNLSKGINLSEEYIQNFNDFKGNRRNTERGER